MLNESISAFILLIVALSLNAEVTQVIPTEPTTLPSTICSGTDRIVAHPYDCAKYVKCDIVVHKVIQEVECKTGLLFSSSFGSCVEAYNVKCTVGELASTPSSLRISELEAFKLGCRTNNEIIAHPQDCTKYIKCVLASGIIISCLSPNLFDSISKKCVDKNAAVCASLTSVILDENMDTTQIISQTTVTPFISTNIITDTYTTTDQITTTPNIADTYSEIITTTPMINSDTTTITTDKTSTDESFSSTDIISSTTITTTTKIVTSFIDTTVSNSVCEKGKLLVSHPTDCSKYIRCDSNKNIAYIMQCPGVLLFNYEIGICDQPYNVNCGSTESTTTKKSTSSVTDNSETCSNDKNSIPESTNCKKYFECKPGQTITITC